MMEKKRIDRLLAALSALALAAAAGLCLLLRLPQADSTAGRTALHFRGGEAYTLVVLSDGETPASRLAPLVRAAENGGGSASLFFLEEPDAGAQALETVSGAEVPVLLLSCGSAWDTALELSAEEAVAGTVLLSPTGEGEALRRDASVPVMLLGTSSAAAPSPARLAELYNTLSGDTILPSGLSFTSERDGVRLRVLPATLDAYQTFSPAVLEAISGWYRETAGVSMAADSWEGPLRGLCWVLGFGGLAGLLLTLTRVLTDSLTDVSYAVMPLSVRSREKFAAVQAALPVGALTVTGLFALAGFFFDRLPRPVPTLFCVYWAVLGGASLLLYRFGKMPGVGGPLGDSRPVRDPRRLLTGGAAVIAVGLCVLLLEEAGLYRLRPTAADLPALLLYGILAAVGCAGFLYNELLFDQAKLPLPARILLTAVPFLPFALLAFLAIPAYGATAAWTVVLLAGALGIGLLLARLLRLALGNLLLPAVLAGALTGFFAACGSL